MRKYILVDYPKTKLCMTIKQLDNAAVVRHTLATARLVTQYQVLLICIIKISLFSMTIY